MFYWWEWQNGNKPTLSYEKMSNLTLILTKVAKIEKNFPTKFCKSTKIKLKGSIITLIQNE